MARRNIIFTSAMPMPIITGISTVIINIIIIVVTITIVTTMPINITRDIIGIMVIDLDIQSLDFILDSVIDKHD